jgi:hypothetical protein
MTKKVEMLAIKHLNFNRLYTIDTFVSAHNVPEKNKAGH